MSVHYKLNGPEVKKYAMKGRMACYPSELGRDILTSFVENNAYGQIATSDDASGLMSVRTVHLHFIESKDCFAFSTHALSQKTKDVALNSKLSGCYWDASQGIQYRFKANAKVVDAGDAEASDFLQSMWLKMREETRMAYALDELGQPYDTQGELPSVAQRSKAHRGITLVPFWWDVHHFDPKGYRFGRRFVYHLNDGRWEKQSTHLIY